MQHHQNLLFGIIYGIAIFLSILLTMRYINNLRDKLFNSKEVLRNTFEERVKSLSAKHIVQAMIDGLNHEWVKINMSTFGECSRFFHTCFGCAATNTICQLIQQPIPFTVIGTVERRTVFLHTDKDFLFRFEIAIDYLRRGNIFMYNEQAKDIGIAIIPITKIGCGGLPRLNSDNWKEDLHRYQELANALD